MSIGCALGSNRELQAEAVNQASVGCARHQLARASHSLVAQMWAEIRALPRESIDSISLVYCESRCDQPTRIWAHLATKSVP
jgi:hypothetical protein